MQGTLELAADERNRAGGTCQHNLIRYRSEYEAGEFSHKVVAPVGFIECGSG